MAKMMPFHGLLPLPENAAEVSAVPYDVVNSAEAAELAAGKPYSFLHVSRPEIDMEPGINLYDDRIEFVSLGGLVPGISLEAIFMGVSQTRNPHLAAVFYRMKLIESYGTGIGKIQDMITKLVEEEKKAEELKKQAEEGNQ